MNTQPMAVRSVAVQTQNMMRHGSYIGRNPCIALNVSDVMRGLRARPSAASTVLGIVGPQNKEVSDE